MFQFSKRTEWELRNNELARCLGQLKARGVSVLDLTESNPTQSDVHYPESEILRPMSDPNNLLYSPNAAGLLSAREAVSAYYQEKAHSVPANRIVLTSSTSEGYSFLFRLLADPGDHILFPKPSYPLFQFLSDLNDVSMDFYSFHYNSQPQRWQIDFDELDKGIHPLTKAIVLVNPNNPTGTFVKESERKRINEFCRRHNLAVICDEVFLDYPSWGNEPLARSWVDNTEVLTFVMSGISKILALPQMKLSWISVNGQTSMAEPAVQRLEVITDTYLSVNTPAQNALPEWMKIRTRVANNIQNRVEQNEAFLKHILREGPACLLNREGGWYAVLKLSERFKDEEWVTELLMKDHVLVHPGYLFDFDEDGYVVLSLLTLPRVMEEGVRRIRENLQT
jgi:hypothetical protein